jgi:hypothetical protein
LSLCSNTTVFPLQRRTNIPPQDEPAAPSKPSPL